VEPAGRVEEQPVRPADDLEEGDVDRGAVLVDAAPAVAASWSKAIWPVFAS
jgi:hypothetical protein